MTAVCAATTILLWAGAFLAMDAAVRATAPLSVAAARFGIAALPCAAWLWAHRARCPSRRDLPRVVLCSLIGIALYNFLLGTGQRSVPPAEASFIIATQPIFAGITGALLLRECFGPRAWLGSAVALTGVALIRGVDPHSLGDSGGALLVLAAAACSGTYFVLQRPIADRFGPLLSSAATITVAALLLLPWLPAGLGAMRQAPGTAGAILFLALGPALIGYTCWMVALRAYGAAKAATLLFLIAPVATLMQAARDGVPPNAMTLIGGALALAGTALALARPKISQPPLRFESSN